MKIALYTLICQISLVSIVRGYDDVKILDDLKSKLQETIERSSTYLCFAAKLKVTRMDENNTEVVDHIDHLASYFEPQNFAIKTTRVENNEATEYITLANSRYVAYISRVEGEEWNLMKLERVKESELKSRRLGLCAIYLPIEARIVNYYLPHVLNQNNHDCKLLSANTANTSRIELTFPQDAVFDGRPLGRTSVVLDVDKNSGLISRYEDSFGDAPEKYKYVRTRSNPVTIGGKTYWSNSKAHMTRDGVELGGDDWTFDLSRIDERLPPEAFYLKYYGISEPNDARFSNWTIALFVLAVLGMIGGTYLARKYSTSK